MRSPLKRQKKQHIAQHVVGEIEFFVDLGTLSISSAIAVGIHGQSLGPRFIFRNPDTLLFRKGRWVSIAIQFFFQKSNYKHFMKFPLDARRPDRFD